MKVLKKVSVLLNGVEVPLPRQIPPVDKVIVTSNCGHKLGLREIGSGVTLNMFAKFIHISKESFWFLFIWVNIQFNSIISYKSVSYTWYFFNWK